jgi:acyl carrier protein
MKKNKKLELEQNEIKEILNILNDESFKTKYLTKSSHIELCDKLANTYINNFDSINGAKNLFLQKSLLNKISYEDILKIIIHFLSILTGYPEGSIKLNTKLDDIGLTPIKREILRQRLNKYLSENGYQKSITPTEMNNCETVKDLYDLVISKTT